MPSAQEKITDQMKLATAQIRKTAPELAKAAEHIGQAMRSSYLKLYEAIQSCEIPSVTEAVEKIKNSDLITGTVAKFHNLKEDAKKFWDIVSPFAGVAAGVIIGLFGWNIGGLIGAVLVVLGFMCAAVSAPTLGKKAIQRVGSELQTQQ